MDYPSLAMDSRCTEYQNCRPLGSRAKQFGLNISGDDIINFANFLAPESDNVQSLGASGRDLSSFSRLIGGVISNSVPDLGSLLNILSYVGTIIGELQNVANSISQHLSNMAQRIWNWIGQLRQQLNQIFVQMENWVSQHLSLIASQVNSLLNWLYSSMNSAVSYLYNVLQGLLQAQNTSQSAQTSMSAMSTTVPQSSDNAWRDLSDRLQQMSALTQQNIQQFCTQYEPVSGYVKTITAWGGRAAIYGFGILTGGAAVPVATMTVAGLSLAENTVDVECSYSLSGSVDPFQVISLAGSASILLGDVFPHEEGSFGALNNILNFIATSIPVTQQLARTMGSSGYDLSGVASLISSYQTASGSALAAYHQSTPNYVGALSALASSPTCRASMR